MRILFSNYSLPRDRMTFWPKEEHKNRREGELLISFSSFRASNHTRFDGLRWFILLICASHFSAEYNSDFSGDYSSRCDDWFWRIFSSHSLIICVVVSVCFLAKRVCHHWGRQEKQPVFFLCRRIFIGILSVIWLKICVYWKDTLEMKLVLYWIKMRMCAPKFVIKYTHQNKAAKNVSSL